MKMIHSHLRSKLKPDILDSILRIKLNLIWSKEKKSINLEQPDINNPDEYPDSDEDNDEDSDKDQDDDNDDDNADFIDIENDETKNDEKEEDEREDYENEEGNEEEEKV